jgi:hypothetical protein
MYPSIIEQDQDQLTSKVKLTYNSLNQTNDRRHLTPAPSAFNTEFIQMDLTTIHKENQSTIEQIQGWIKSDYKFFLFFV